MDFQLTRKQEILRNSLRDFLAGECTSEYIRMIDEKEEFPFDLFYKFAKLGFMALPFPVEYGGAGGNTVDLCIANEEVSRYGGSVMNTLTGTMMFALGSIYSYGSEEQKKKYLPLVSKGELIVSYALTEPNAGSDAASLTTSAVKDGNDYIVNGNKIFITRAHVADYIITVTRTDPTLSKHKGLTVFMIDRKSPGITINPLKKLGHKAVHSCVVFFENVRVPQEMMLGGLNQGWGNMIKHLDVERVVSGAGSLGHAQGALDLSLDYAKKREQFGHPIGSYGVIQHYLADMATRVEASRWMVYRAAWMESQGVRCSKECSMAKYYSSEVATYVANKGMQIMGGYGYTMDYDMQRFYRECKMAEVAGGSTEMQKYIIAREMGLPRTNY
ncbi:MAG: acyl-CoA dehydrogenase family protein [Dehalococcoidia bacterium]|nr:acyl-CoA dehydrogenase family protein [Dehalococcoidia bacterium]